MRVVVTGADGFVGPWVVRALDEAGHEVVAATGPEPGRVPWPAGLRTRALDLFDASSIAEVAAEPCDALIHLAAVASGRDALRDPLAAWEVNAMGTVRLISALADRLKGSGGDGPTVLVVSTAEVYGTGPRRPRVEQDLTRPRSPYAASKLAGEVAALEVHRRTGLPVVIARPFSHTGPGQDSRFVAPALAQRLVTAKRVGAPVIEVGNLEPVREFLHVADVAQAYCLLVTKGVPGEIYNVASGTGVSLRELLEMLMDAVGHRVIPEVAAALQRPADIPYLVGDASKLQAATGWRPRVSLPDTLHELVHAQAN